MTHPLSAHKYPRRSNGPLCLFFILAILLLAGCAGRGKPQYQVNQYLLDYAAPAIAISSPVTETLRLERFAVAVAYNNTNMAFRSDRLAIDAFNYSRWAVNPADMTADLLLRDLRAGGFFAAVFSRYEQDNGRFVLQGAVEEFYLDMAPSSKKAVLSLTVTLKDLSRKEAARRIIFQKKYAAAEALTEETPGGFAKAMSKAMQGLTEEILKDIYSGAQKAQAARQAP
ncbi:MAG: ABC-type transport auxiliary lipoprotein family protein [Smithellaceae bacterium]